MSFFKSSKSHVEILEQDCKAIMQQAGDVRERCDRSLKGKYANMLPEDRAALLKEAAAISKKLHVTLESVRERERLMAQDQCPNEDLLAANALVLDASLDVQRADKSLEDARQSLLAGMAEIEQFYGVKSKEARLIHKVLDELQSG
jgi:hypothetical protein